MSDDDVLMLIARVLAWESGYDAKDIESTARSTHYQDYAQQCAEDLGYPTPGNGA